METKHQRAPHPFFDALLIELRERNEKTKTAGGLVRANDAALCRLLDVQQPTLSKMRKGVIPVSDTMRVKVMRTFNWPLKRVDELAPPAAAEQAGAVQ